MVTCCHNFSFIFLDPYTHAITCTCILKLYRYEVQLVGAAMFNGQPSSLFVFKTSCPIKLKFWVEHHNIRYIQICPNSDVPTCNMAAMVAKLKNIFDF